jgi:S1-C subfamily serine protease
MSRRTAHTVILGCLLLLLVPTVFQEWQQLQIHGRAILGRDEALTRALTPATTPVHRSMVEIVLPRHGRLAYGLVTGPGEVLTSGHLGGLRGVLVRDQDGNLYSCRLRAADGNNDLLLLEVPRLPEDLPAARLDRTGPPPEAGRFAISVGPSPTPVAVGLVSATGRTISGRETFRPIIIRGFTPSQDRVNRTALRYLPEVIQHDSPLHLTELGSALVDSRGRLLGLNVSNVLRGTSYAIPRATLQLVVPILREGQSISTKARGFLGIETRPAPLPLLERLGVEGAVVVRGVLPDTPADQAGIAPGDVILSVGDRAILDYLDLVQSISAREPGEPVDFTISRDDAIRTVRVELMGVDWRR